RTAHGARAVQSSLRSAQHLHAIQVVEVGVHHHLAVESRGGRAQRIVVEVEADGGRGAARGGKTPHLELRLTRTGGAHRNAGYRLDDIVETRDTLLAHEVAGERRHADRRVLNGGGALLRR